MGHCDSSARIGGNDGLCAIDGRSVGSIASRENFSRSARVDTGMGKKNNDPEPGISQAADRSLGFWVLLFLVRFYIVFLSPFFGGSCRFYPSCSNYAFEAIATHGARRGFLLAVKRLLRCRPFTEGGFDPVPEAERGRRPALIPESIAFTTQTPMAGCMGSPFATSIPRHAPRVGGREEPAQ